MTYKDATKALVIEFTHTTPKLNTLMLMLLGERMRLERMEEPTENIDKYLDWYNEAFARRN